MQATTVRRHMSSIKGDAERLQVLEQLCGTEIHESINARQRYNEAVARNQQDGMIGVIISSTDCDWTHSKYARVMPVSALRGFLDDLYADREGPTSHLLVSPEHAYEYQGTTRALEAFEDGHAHCIYA